MDSVRKKTLLTILCLFSLLSLLSATPSLPAPRSFFLVHTLASNPVYHFSFKDMADTPSEITSADVSSGGKFARLVINFNDDVSYNVTLRFSPLVHDTFADTYCEYTMELLRPDSTNVLASVVPDQEIGHSACHVNLNGNIGFAFNGTNVIWQDEYLADLKITLDTDSAIAGRYTGTIIIEQVTDGGS